MNYSDTVFIAIAVSIGLGAGFWAGAEYGKIGFLFGLLGGFAAVFILFTVARMLMPEGPRHRSREQQE